MQRLQTGLAQAEMEYAGWLCRAKKHEGVSVGATSVKQQRQTLMKKARLFVLSQPTSLDGSYPSTCCALAAYFSLRQQTARKSLCFLEWLYSLMPASCKVMRDWIITELAASLTSHNIPLCCYHVHCFALAVKLRYFFTKLYSEGLLHSTCCTFTFYKEIQ